MKKVSECYESILQSINQSITPEQKMNTQKSLRPIPIARVQTFFWSAGVCAPSWFQVDTAPVDTIRCPSVQIGREWIIRRRSEGRDLPRVIAFDNETGSLYWLYDDDHKVCLDSFGNPMFTTITF